MKAHSFFEALAFKLFCFQGIPSVLSTEKSFTHCREFGVCEFQGNSCGTSARSVGPSCFLVYRICAFVHKQPSFSCELQFLPIVGMFLFNETCLQVLIFFLLNPWQASKPPQYPVELSVKTMARYCSYFWIPHILVASELMDLKNWGIKEWSAGACSSPTPATPNLNHWCCH